MNFIRAGAILGRSGPSGRVRTAGAGSRLIHLSSGSAEKFSPTKVKLDKGREVKWCSCGQTKTKPFCDASSACKGKPVLFKANESKDYVFCNCKQSKNKPFCDATHAKL